MTRNYDKLKTLLIELFQLDQPEEYDSPDFHTVVCICSAELVDSSTRSI